MQLTCHIGFQDLEGAYLAHHLYANGAPDYYSLFINCDNIVNSSISSNLYMSEQDPHSAVHNAKIAMDRHIIPFLDRYSDTPDAGRQL